MAEPVLMFGLGAAKAGTSWLHRWLSGHDQCHLRGVKELHFFDTLEKGRLADRVAELRAERARLEARGVRRQRLRDIDALIGVFETGTEADYLAYLRDGAKRAHVVGDITPAYGLLPEGRLRDMAALGNARFVQILRDPVDRLWSHVRMIAARRAPDGQVAPDHAHRILYRTLRGEEGQITLRSDYMGMLDRLRAAVPARARLVVFFEDLFTTAGHAICDFLGIRRIPLLAAAVHQGQPLAMTAAQFEDARDWLAPQYHHVERTLGRLPDRWALTERT